MAAILGGARVSGIGPLTGRIPTIRVLTGGILTGLIGALIPDASIMTSRITLSLPLTVSRPGRSIPTGGLPMLGRFLR